MKRGTANRKSEEVEWIRLLRRVRVFLEQKLGGSLSKTTRQFWVLSVYNITLFRLGGNLTGDRSW